MRYIWGYTVQLLLTEISIRNIKPPATGYVLVHDPTFPGFAVRVTGKSKAFVYTHTKTRKRVTLGPVSMGLRAARQKARELLDEPEPSLTFREALDAFISSRKALNRASTAAETERLLNRHFGALGTRPAAELTAPDFLDIVRGLKPSEANHAFTAIKTALRWMRGNGYIEKHPLEDAQRPWKAPNRSRWLTGEEIAKLLSTGQTGPYPALLKALLYTGQRLGQLNPFNPAWIQGDTVRFPPEVMKSGHEHIIPITETTKTILGNLSLIRSWGEHTTFLKESGIAHFTRHDLRRTYATHMAQLGIAPHIIERLLDHQGGTISGVAAIYNRHHFLAEMRLAVEAFEAHLEKLATTA